MKTTKIKIRNLFGITALEIDGKSVELTGANGTGKTSVLDAIKFALTNNSNREYVIKSGEREGEILIETDTGLTIDRKARTDRAGYKSVKQGNTPIGSPEAFLKTIFTPLQLQPLEFIGMSKKEQNALILDTIQFDWNMDTIRGWFGEIPEDVNYDQNILSVLNDIQADNGAYFQKRQDINREIRAKRAIAADIEAALPMGYNGNEWKNANVGALYTEAEKIRKENETVEKAKRLLEGHDGKIRALQADRDIKLAAIDKETVAEEKRIESEIASMEERIRALRDKRAGLNTSKEQQQKVARSEYEAAVSKLETQIEAYSKYADMETKDISDILSKAAETEKMKSFVGEWERMNSINESIDGLTAESEELTRKIELARNLPGQILETATIPISGLTVKDGIPLINGLPVSNLSDGEKMSLCVDLAVQNPAGFQILLLDGVEALSEANRKKVYEKCKEKGLQIIATRTTEDNVLNVVEL